MDSCEVNCEKCAELQRIVDDLLDTRATEHRNAQHFKEKLAAAEAEVERLRAEAIRLFCLLDDIDTAEDMFKLDDSAHFRYVHNKHRERFEGILTTDGFTVIVEPPR